MGEKVAKTGAGRFTDEERRGMAVALRELAKAGSSVDLSRSLIDREAFDEQMLLASVDAVIGKRERLSLLADAIDRPTCRAVQPCPGAFYECSACGYDSWVDCESVTSYCPNCGAEVIG